MFYFEGLATAVDRKREEELQKSELRIARIKDECSRKVEETVETWKKEMQRKVC